MDAFTTTVGTNLQDNSLINLIRKEFTAPISGSSRCRKRFNWMKTCKAD